MSDNLITRAGKPFTASNGSQSLLPPGSGIMKALMWAAVAAAFGLVLWVLLLGPRGRYGTVSGADELRHLCIFAEIGDNNDDQT